MATRDMTEDRTHTAAVRRVLLIVLLLNAVVAFTKIGLGAFMGSVSLFADGVHAVLDGLSNVVGLVGLAIAARPADDNHPYGHKRFETLASVLIGFFIAGGLWKIGASILDAMHGEHSLPQVSWLSTSIVVATLLVNIAITTYESKRGRELGSAILTADAAHTFSDSLGVLVVLASFAGVALGFAWADLVAASIVAVLIGYTSYRVIVPNLRILADEVRLDPERILDAARSVEGVRGAHKARSRGAADSVQVDLHIQVDEGMSVRDAHTITHRVIDAIRAAIPEVKDVVVHTEPASNRR